MNPYLDQARELLGRFYGYRDFRPAQAPVIESLLAGHDTLAIMPTGAGKSICFQIPALIFPGLTLVISPLISLMKDQVDALVEQGIPATYINSSLSLAESDARLSAIAQGRYKLVYVAPERLDADGFVELGNEDVLVYSAYGSKILSLQPSYARPVLAVGGTHFVVYNRAGSELTVCSRTRTLYTQRFDEDILLCAMSNNNSLAVVTDADRFAGWVHIYDPSMRELYSWRMPQSMGTPIALDFAPDNRRFASGMIAARDGQLNCSVYFMSLDSDTEGLLYTADAGSMLLRLDWQSENRVMAVFDTYIAVIDPRTAAEVARYDYGGAALQSVAPGRRQTALLLNVHGGNSLVTLSESLTVMSEIPARQAFAVSATDTDIYLLCPDAVECYGYDGVQNWVQTGLPSRPLAVLHGKQTLVFTGSQAHVLAKPAE